ncbi:FAD assembly factor SdhE [Orbus mooreae]|uniref:FAD assembly factor SdhE n=1 Tax=Orbus mooreae TaxID=3074107 RepID=UPI00370DAE47
MTSLSKITWSCRRGMKELELYLLPFVENNFCLLNEQQIIYLEQLLALDDLVLFACFFEQEKLTNPHQQALVNLIKLYHQ